LVEPVRQKPAIGKTGQLVVIREPARFLDLALESYDVLLEQRMSYSKRVDLLQRCAQCLSVGREVVVERPSWGAPVQDLCSHPRSTGPSSIRSL